jgi:hypothetical protein
VVVEATPEPKAEPKQEVPAVTADIPEDLAAMLSDWDDG